MKLIATMFFITLSFLSHGSKIEMNNDTNCMALALYFEARGEILSGSVAVAELIHTRMRSNYYPSTACDVVKSKSWSSKHQKYICAFEWYCNKNNLYVDMTKKAELKGWHQAVVLSQSYLSSTPPCFELVKHASLFHDKSITPWWADDPNVKLIAIIGSLYFYTEKRGGVLISKNDVPNYVSIRS